MCVCVCLRVWHKTKAVFIEANNAVKQLSIPSVPPLQINLNANMLGVSPRMTLPGVTGGGVACFGVVWSKNIKAHHTLHTLSLLCIILM